MRTAMLPYGHQSIDEDDINAVSEVLRGDFITQGPKVEEFEGAIAAYCGAKYAVVVSSGTAALQVACEAAGIKKGDEVITTPLTFVATAAAIVRCGARPRFVDIRLDNLGLNFEELDWQSIPYHATAIMPVDFAGLPCDLDEIMMFAHENPKQDLLVIEDGCHAFGATYNGRKIGSVADMTIFSFHPVKAIAVGEGGAITTNDLGLYKRMLRLRHHGIVKQGESSWYYEIPQLGYNFRLTDIQCALGLSQLKKVDRFIARRQWIARMYEEAFAEVPELIIPMRTPQISHAYHIYVVQLQLDRLRWSRNQVIDALRAKNIGATVHYTPLHLQTFFQKTFGYKKGEFPNAEKYYDSAVTLPIFPAMTDSDVYDVIQAVTEVIGACRR